MNGVEGYETREMGRVRRGRREEGCSEAEEQSGTKKRTGGEEN